MNGKKIWHLILTILPVYGAYNSMNQGIEPWIGFLAGLLVSGLLWSLGKAIILLQRKFAKKEIPDSGQNPVDTNFDNPSVKQTHNYKKGLFRVWLVISICWCGFYTWNGVKYAQSIPELKTNYDLWESRSFEMMGKALSAPEHDPYGQDRESYMSMFHLASDQQGDFAKKIIEARENVKKAWLYGPALPIILLLMYFTAIYIANGFSKTK